LQTVKESERIFQEEIQELTKKIGEGETASKLAKELQKSNENCKADYERKEQELLNTISDLKQQVNDLMQDKESATQANLTSPNVSIIDPETLSDLKSELEMVKTTAAKLKQDNTRFTAENEEMNHLTHSLRLEISQLKSTLEEKEDEIMTYRESARAAHEEIKLMNAIEVDEVEVDVAPKGNSLFAEVDDRRLVVEEQLKNYQIRVKELKVLYEKKVTENNKLRMQNIHLMNMASSTGSSAGKCEQSHVEHLHDLLKLEKQKNSILKSQLSDNHEQNSDDQKGFQEKLLQQTFEDGEKMHEMSKALAEQDRAMAKLKADNCKLKMRINEIQSQKVNQAETKKKSAQKVVVENIVFDAKPSKPQIKLEEAPEAPQMLPSPPLKESTNQLKTSPVKSKKVSFSDDTCDEPEVKKKIPRVQVERKIIDAKAESEKMQEQCNQQ